MKYFPCTYKLVIQMLKLYIINFFIDLMDVHLHLTEMAANHLYYFSLSKLKFCNEHSVLDISFIVYRIYSLWSIKFSIFSAFYVQSSLVDVKKICEINLIRYI